MTSIEKIEMTKAVFLETTSFTHDLFISSFLFEHMNVRVI